MTGITDETLPVAERRLLDALAAIEDWRGCEICYEPVLGGISNANWRVHVAGHPQSYFVKVPGEGTEMFIDRHAANEAGRKAHAAGVGAQVFHFLPDSGVEVSAFVDGLRTATNADFNDPVIRRNALVAIRRFNDEAPLTLVKTTFDMIDEHILQVLQLGGHFPADFEWINARYREARAALEAPGLDLAPCMNDTLAGNFLIDADGKILLVDFEYASTNDRCAELALWFAEQCFTPEVEAEMLQLYFGDVTPRLLARIGLFKALLDLKWATWAMVQNRVSALDFDFFKYGTWKHLRARHAMRDPRWGSWLEAAATSPDS